VVRRVEASGAWVVEDTGGRRWLVRHVDDPFRGAGMSRANPSKSFREAFRFHSSADRGGEVGKHAVWGKRYAAAERAAKAQGYYLGWDADEEGYIAILYDENGGHHGAIGGIDEATRSDDAYARQLFAELAWEHLGEGHKGRKR
jgi:hypothetical protein